MKRTTDSSGGSNGWPKGKRRQGPTHSQQHGFHTLKTTLQRLGSRILDPDAEMGRELAAWRSSLIEDLGGEENLTTSELALIGLAVRDRLLLDSVDAWLLSQPHEGEHQDRHSGAEHFVASSFPLASRPANLRTARASSRLHQPARAD